MMQSSLNLNRYTNMQPSIRKNPYRLYAMAGCAILYSMGKRLATSINREYALRLVGVTLLFWVLSGWFLFDGAYGYPQENAKVTPVFQSLAKQELTATDWMNTAKTGVAPLVEAFRKAGLNVPKKITETFQSWERANDPRAHSITAAQQMFLSPLYDAEAIRTQFISAAIGFLAGVGLLGLLLIRLMTRFEWDGVALSRYTLGKTRTFPRKELRHVDDSQWHHRGILKLCFEHGSVTLDAWHHAGIRPIAEVFLQPHTTCNPIEPAP